MGAVFLLLLFVLEIVFSIYIIMEGKSRKVWVQGRALRFPACNQIGACTDFLDVQEKRGR